MRDENIRMPRLLWTLAILSSCYLVHSGRCGSTHGTGCTKTQETNRVHRKLPSGNQPRLAVVVKPTEVDMVQASLVEGTTKEPPPAAGDSPITLALSPESSWGDSEENAESQSPPLHGVTPRGKSRGYEHLTPPSTDAKRPAISPSK